VLFQWGGQHLHIRAAKHNFYETGSVAQHLELIYTKQCLQVPRRPSVTSPVFDASTVASAATPSDPNSFSVSQIVRFAEQDSHVHNTQQQPQTQHKEQLSVASCPTIDVPETSRSVRVRFAQSPFAKAFILFPERGQPAQNHKRMRCWGRATPERQELRIECTPLRSSV
jgi:CCR4-NOT transcriptional regulation complex NOT5 subunit